MYYISKAQSLVKLSEKVHALFTNKTRGVQWPNSEKPWNVLITPRVALRFTTELFKKFTQIVQLSDSQILNEQKIWIICSAFIYNAELQKNAFVICNYAVAQTSVHFLWGSFFLLPIVYSLTFTIRHYHTTLHMCSPPTHLFVTLQKLPNQTANWC